MLKAELAQIRFEYETVKSELKSVTDGRDYCISQLSKAEWLLDHPLLCKLSNAQALDEWRKRYATWRKGGAQ